MIVLSFLPITKTGVHLLFLGVYYFNNTHKIISNQTRIKPRHLCIYSIQYLPVGSSLSDEWQLPLIAQVAASLSNLLCFIIRVVYYKQISLYVWFFSLFCQSLWIPLGAHIIPNKHFYGPWDSFSFINNSGTILDLTNVIHLVAFSICHSKRHYTIIFNFYVVCQISKIAGVCSKTGNFLIPSDEDRSISNNWFLLL